MASNALRGGGAGRSDFHGPRAARRFMVPGLALVAFLGVAVGLQILAGAYRVELSGYPDESGHFVTGVLVHDYLTTFPPRSPVPFAKEFYIHRPKIAIGHWPPVLYLFEGIWFVIFHVSRESVLALMASISAAVAASIFHVVRRWHGTATGIAAGLFFLCLAFVQEQTSQVMADMLVTLFGFWATISFADFLSGRRASDIYRFAIFSLLAIFTKNSGLYLVFIPLFSILFTGRFEVFKSVRLWIGASIVGIPTALWLAWSHKYVSSSWVEKPGVEFFARATRFDLFFLYLILGPWLLILVIGGIVWGVIQFRSTGDPSSAALTAAALSVVLFQSLAPAGIEWRFLLPAIAAMIPLLFSGLMWLAESIGPRAVPRMLRAVALLAVAILLSPGRTFAIPHKPSRGFSEVADFIQSQPQLRRGAILVSSASDGEGILISELVMRYPNSEGYILRASKVLGQSDWLMRSYVMRFGSADQVFNYLDAMGVDMIVIEDQTGAQAPGHQALLLQAGQDHLNRWKPVVTFPKGSPDGKRSRILVYQRVVSSARSDEEIHRDMQEILLRMLGE